MLRDGNYNQDPETAVKAIMVGSMAEDSYTTVPSNCDFQTFKDTVYSQYLFEDYVGKNTSVWDRMVPLYNSTAAPHSDGPPPVGMNRWNRTWDHYYWASAVFRNQDKILPAENLLVDTDGVLRPADEPSARGERGGGSNSAGTSRCGSLLLCI